MVYGGKRYIELKQRDIERKKNLSFTEYLTSEIEESEERDRVHSILIWEGEGGLRDAISSWIDNLNAITTEIGKYVSGNPRLAFDEQQKIATFKELLRIAEAVINRK